MEELKHLQHLDTSTNQEYSVFSFWIIFRPGVIKEIPRPLIGYNQPLPGQGYNCQVRPGTGDSRLSTMFIFPSHTKQFKLDRGSIRSSLRDGLSKYSCRVVEQCRTVTEDWICLSWMLQHIDNGAASKKLDLGLDLSDPRSSFIHILHFTTIYYLCTSHLNLS